MNFPAKIPDSDSLRFFASKFPEMEISAIESTICLLHVASQVFSAMDCHFTRHSLSRGRFQVMMLLMRQEDRGLSPAHLAEHLGVSRATMTGLLDTLESKGLVKRNASSDDRRTLLVQMTDAGRSHMQTMLPDHYRRASALMEALSEKDRETFQRILKKVESGLSKVREP